MGKRIGKPTDLLMIGEAAALLGIGVRTLRLYANEDKIACERGPGDRRIFHRSDIDAYARSRLGHDAEKVILYARVSSHRQVAEGDLARQIEHLRATALAAGHIVVGEYHDIASGLADGRRGLASALDACSRPEVSKILVTHRERLARFGTGPMEELLGALGVSLVITGEDVDLVASAKSELVRDMLAIVTSFSGRLYGHRSARARAARKAVAMSLR